MKNKSKIAKKSSDKPIAQILAAISEAKGMKYAVISSGSRNAPLIIAFDAEEGIECLSIIDERSAAFFALGIAQQTGSPVGLICTSGSAALNYAPAIAEAYYQKIPLIVITADRPPEWIDQDDGQTINQKSVYSNYCKASYNLPVEPTHPDELWYAQRLISEAFNNATEFANEGPVHINVPLREPLYGLSEKINTDYKIIHSPELFRQLYEADEKYLYKTWNRAKKKMIVCGLHKPDGELKHFLGLVSKNSSVAIVTEATSNLQNENYIGNIDAVLDSLDEKEKELFKPEILVTLGGPVTSKKLKTYLRQYKPAEHWHISVSGSHTDTFQSLTRAIGLEPSFILSILDSHGRDVESDYSKELKSISENGHKKLNLYCPMAPFSDLKVMDIIWDNIPDDSDVHFGNSSPIRYANLFETDVKKKMNYYSNRGVSGIDGATSTASGAAFASGRITILITGDLAFFYDSNALWNKYLPGNLRIIVINNGGGGIFRLIDSKETPLLEKYFEAKHTMKAEGLVKAHDIPYYSAKDEVELKLNLNNLYKDHKGKPAVLEVFTPSELNAEVWAGYFKSLKQ